MLGGLRFCLIKVKRLAARGISFATLAGTQRYFSCPWRSFRRFVHESECVDWESRINGNTVRSQVFSISTLGSADDFHHDSRYDGSAAANACLEYKKSPPGGTAGQFIGGMFPVWGGSFRRVVRPGPRASPSRPRLRARSICGRSEEFLTDRHPEPCGEWQSHGHGGQVLSIPRR